MKALICILCFFLGVAFGIFSFRLFKEYIEPDLFISCIEVKGESARVELGFSGLRSGEIMIVPRGTIFGEKYATNSGNVIPTSFIDKLELKEYTTFLVFDHNGFIKKSGRFIVNDISISGDVICLNVIDGTADLSLPISKYTRESINGD